LAGDGERVAVERLVVERDIGVEQAEGRDARESIGMPLEGAEHGIAEDVIVVPGLIGGGTAALDLGGRSDERQLLGMRHRERRKDGLVEQRKDGGIGADTQTQRQHHRQTKQRRFRKTADRVTQACHV
jgi:hypothetical protein